MVSAVFHSPARRAPCRCRSPERGRATPCSHAARPARGPRTAGRDGAAPARSTGAASWLRGAAAAARHGAAGRHLGAADDHHQQQPSRRRRPPSTRRVELFADPFYRKGPNDQGIGWNMLYLAAARGAGLRPGGAGGHPAGLRDRPLRVPEPHGLAADQPAAAGVAAGLAADRPAGVQGRQPGGHLDHLHLLDLADGHQHRGGRAARAAGLPERGARAEPVASGRSSPRSCSPPCCPTC